jgi:Cu/Ag efflux protein CusF
MKSMTKYTSCFIAVCTALALTACSSSSRATSAASQPLPQGTVGENVVTATAVVKKIDQKTRMVTLQRADGSDITFRVDDSVRNLPQVKAGDEVTVTYYESLAYAVRKPGDAQVGAVVAEDVARAPKGERPGAAVGRVTTVTTTIAAIDKKAGTVTLKGADGEPTVVKVRDPANLDRVSVGELVEITLTEAVAIAVEPPQK